MKTIKERFEEYVNENFSAKLDKGGRLIWNVENFEGKLTVCLPEIEYTEPDQGRVYDAVGWHTYFHLYDDYFDIYYCHRMTNDRHHRVFLDESKEEEYLPTSDGYMYQPKEKQAEYSDRVYKELTEKYKGF